MRSTLHLQSFCNRSAIVLQSRRQPRDRSIGASHARSGPGLDKRVSGRASERRRLRHDGATCATNRLALQGTPTIWQNGVVFPKSASVKLSPPVLQA
jgi:hypothetical protein